ncbi:uncharacterized protein conserved in bacteria [Paenibacillus popilliae ATCC 14706]|uniref:Uncharacterized protein conserved in bacteria n=1 Tax=Paenibacillus popilliae ATCC 14706 TaxID=1212764 RepID=M9M0S3_PAEPP|nr:uncharacterized protein conserved in bacteria [Paenibacillus popilliae ATCC 14706]
MIASVAVPSVGDGSFFVPLPRDKDLDEVSIRQKQSFRIKLSNVNGSKCEKFEKVEKICRYLS